MIRILVVFVFLILLFVAIYIWLHRKLTPQPVLVVEQPADDVSLAEKTEEELLALRTELEDKQIAVVNLTESDAIKVKIAQIDQQLAALDKTKHRHTDEPQI